MPVSRWKKPSRHSEIPETRAGIKGSIVMFRTGVSALILNESDEPLLVNLESFEEQYFAIPGGGL